MRIDDLPGNEAEVGQGIKDGGINRDELWLTSKASMRRFYTLAGLTLM